MPVRAPVHLVKGPKGGRPNWTFLHAKQMEVYNSLARYRTVVAGRRWGKTQLSKTEMIREARKPGRLVWYIAPTYQMARQIMWEDLKDTVPRKWIKKINETQMSISLKNNSVIALKGADKPDTLRGVGLHFVVLDEFQDMRPETWNTVIQPTLASTRGRSLFIGCVKGDTRVLSMSDGMRNIDSYAKGSSPGTLDPMDEDFYGLNRMGHNADGFWNNGVVETRKITSRWGFEMESSLPHPVWVMGENGRPFWKKTEDIEHGDRIAIARGMEVWGDKNPLAGFDAHMTEWRKQFEGKRGAKPVPLSSGLAMTDDLAYFMGLWIAEGSIEIDISRVTITCGDRSVGDFLESGRVAGLRFTPRPGRDDQWSVNSMELVELMRYIGMPLVKAPQKRIPNWVTAGRRVWARHFIAGMWDGDGHVLSNGSARCGYSSASKGLVRDLQLLMSNLNIVGRVTSHNIPATDRAKESIQHRYTVQGVNITLFSERIPLRIERKAAAFDLMTLPTWSRRDGVPNQGDMIRNVRNSLRRRFQNKKCHKDLFSAALNRGSDISYRNLEIFVETHEDSTHPDLLSLRDNLSDHYYWDVVESVEKSQAETFDFTIPDTHSFWSNGFISHNTPKSFNHLYDHYMRGQSADEESWESWQFQTISSPFILPEEIHEARRNMSEKEFRQEFEASFETMSNRVYHAFDRNKHVKRVKFDPRLPIRVGMDFNINPMSAVLFQIHGDGKDAKIKVFDEVNLRNSNTFEMSEELERRYWRHRKQIIIYPDPAGGSKSTTSRGDSDFSILRQKGFKRLKYRRRHPRIRDRVNSVNRMLMAADGTIRTEVDHSCKEFIKSLEQTQYKKDSNDIDKAASMEHMTDAFGYGVEIEFPVRELRVLGVSI